MAGSLLARGRGPFGYLAPYRREGTVWVQAGGLPGNSPGAMSESKEHRQSPCQRTPAV
ncbi:hypothetical protein OF385_12980 [Glutamicibacter sp. JL.03c]|uniref:hypothetical protein n=1 Tax=Glutamicibacter sp. JL.03c TaxID=2984842 RepID=UPI0021F7E2CD|nr:hypothetical protein [Glutamicibacter sp. JL.03c]UYQ76921.1 hypothetical protein OF385_12980 [Glutamicibacter sp. JL.03c]